MDEKVLWKFKFLMDKCQPMLEGKKVNLDTLERVRRKVWLYPHHLSSKEAQLRAERDLLAHDFYHGRKGEYVSSQLPQL